MTQAVSNMESRLSRFTAVDLITIAIFAVLLRTVFYYSYRALSIAFPLNQVVFPLFMAFCMATLLILVPKPGTVILWTITWQAINFFFQGETPLYIAMYIPIPIVVELIFWMMKNWGTDLRTSMIGNIVYQALHITVTYIAIVYVFLIEWSFTSFLILLPIGALVATPIGTYIGFQLGNRLKRLIA